MAQATKVNELLLKHFWSNDIKEYDIKTSLFGAFDYFTKKIVKKIMIIQEILILKEVHMQLSLDYFSPPYFPSSSLLQD